MNLNSAGYLYAGVTLLLIGCSAPVAYINSLPGHSKLEKKGDFNFKANLGADFRFKEPVYDLELTYAPAEHWGLRVHSSSGSSPSYYDQRFYYDLATVYFLPINEVYHFEILSGYGRGNVSGNSANIDIENYGNHLPGRFISNSSDQRVFIQPSVLINEPDSDFKIALGTRFQRVFFEYFYYEKVDRYIMDEPGLSTWTVDPFMDLFFDQKFIGINAKLGYSLHIGDRDFVSQTHPKYRHLFYSFGVYLFINPHSD